VEVVRALEHGAPGCGQRAARTASTQPHRPAGQRRGQVYWVVSQRDKAAEYWRFSHSLGRKVQLCRGSHVESSSVMESTADPFTGSLAMRGLVRPVHGRQSTGSTGVSGAPCNGHHRFARVCTGSRRAPRRGGARRALGVNGLAAGKGHGGHGRMAEVSKGSFATAYARQQRSGPACHRAGRLSEGRQQREGWERWPVQREGL
jgi:hypothetical protein